MRNEQSIDPAKVLFVDIETVPAVWQYEELDERGAKLFADKTRFEQERSGKSAQEIYGERGGILAEFGKVVCIGVGALHKQGAVETDTAKRAQIYIDAQKLMDESAAFIWITHNAYTFAFKDWLVPGILPNGNQWQYENFKEA